MNYDLLFAIIFYGLIFLYYIKHKKKFTIENKIFILYKTKLGLKLMDKISKYCPRLQRFFYSFGFVFGFIGMFFIFYMLFKGTLNLLFYNGQPALAPILPGVAVPGLPILSFWHWIVAILILAVLHEFSHGLVARLYDIKVKSSGFAFLGPILAAFVEPNEKELNKSKKHAQLSVYAAGPFINILTGVVFLLISNLLVFSGVQIIGVADGSPIDMTGIGIGEQILEINGNRVEYLSDFKNILSDLTPNEEVTIKTTLDEYKITAGSNPDSPEQGYLGVTVDMIYPADSGFIKSSLVWIRLLLYWLFIASVGVGLFNLLPLGPVDGGKMLYVGVLAITHKENLSKRIWTIASSLCLLLIIINLLPWLYKLLIFLIKPLAILVP
ncbi:MAG: site-2 protease family protein [Candidatus Nanoarchaeia archaeon]|nr:site-2 protease family protein [Candidatus Nanoarchaeia archaeon]